MKEDQVTRAQGERVPKTMALDLGEVTIGLAVSDDLSLTAQGLPTLRRRGLKEDIETLRRIAAELGVEELLLGLPRNMNGSLGAQGEKVMAFARYLGQRLKRPVRLWDERLSTVAAEKALIQAGLRRKRRRQAIDRVAATLILQGYLDSRAGGAKTNEE
ncbi:MAG: Holliday junction resolvase RuvX [candidate division NC10 bacterium]|nr:Holliday junction resolvase RuvX [candidate division NC10 bacterium]